VDIRSLTVGPLAENAHLVRPDGHDRAVLVDPGEEAERLLAAIEDAGVGLDAILLTHTHFDHIGAVAPVARATGAPVYCPAIEAPILADIMSFVPWPGFGPFESYDADVTLDGGERLQLAGLELEVLATPGHSPGHVTFATTDDQGTTQLLSGDVLFQGSIGRTDLPGGDARTLLASIATLLERFDDDAVVHPGHMGRTTLGRERATNPFLQGLPAH
jgi:glyoxylase-like metal-dependent hydrolase (beta-lactamase superfamily II)